MLRSAWLGRAVERSERPSRAVAALLALITLLTAAGAASVLAPPARADSTMLCDGYSACSTGGFSTHGYQSHLSTSYWTMYPGVNCTNYVAYVESGSFAVPTPGYSLGNAAQWAGAAAAHGATVDHTPAVGAVAQWNAYSTGMGADGHVAVVERVGPNASYVDISQDSIGSDTDGYDWRRIYAGTTGWQSWPDNFIHFPGTTVAAPAPAAPPAPVDGDFVQSGGKVYVLAGGAPLYVSSWAAVGGAHPTISLSPAQFAALPSRPKDGTFVRNATGAVFEIVGGAPLYVSNWADLPATTTRVSIPVDAAAITNAGAVAPWSHLAAHPLDGTYLEDGAGSVYVVMEGAPLFVGPWASVAALAPPVIHIDAADLTHAGLAAPWAALRAHPAPDQFLVFVLGGAIHITKVTAGPLPTPPPVRIR